MPENDEFLCTKCGNRVNEEDDFCPHCGSVFAEGVFCEKHRRAEAAGVCIVCGTPCCDECGAAVDGLFLCNHHSEYEIFKGMVKVCGTHDEGEAEFAGSRLSDAGLHPALFHLRVPRHISRPEYVPYRDGEDFNASEIKVMVPCDEVETAEKILNSPTPPDSPPGTP